MQVQRVLGCGGVTPQLPRGPLTAPADLLRQHLPALALGRGQAAGQRQLEVDLVAGGPRTTKA